MANLIIYSHVRKNIFSLNFQVEKRVIFYTLFFALKTSEVKCFTEANKIMASANDVIPRKIKKKFLYSAFCGLSV